MTSRRLDTAHSNFTRELDKLLRLDGENQRRFRAGPGRPGVATITKTQMAVLSEGVFLAAFRHFETMLQESFALYVVGKKTNSGIKARSYLSPRSMDHGLELMQSGMTFLEWNAPSKVISRAELYLSDGYPVKDVVTTNRVLFDDARVIRNHIAHRSKESMRSYRSVAARLLTTAPGAVPDPGELLQSTNPLVPAEYFLITFLEGFRRISTELCT